MTNTPATDAAVLVAPYSDRVQVSASSGLPEHLTVGIIRCIGDDDHETDEMLIPFPVDVLCQVDDILQLKEFCSNWVKFYRPGWEYFSMQLACFLPCDFGPEPF